MQVASPQWLLPCLPVGSTCSRVLRWASISDLRCHWYLHLLSKLYWYWPIPQSKLQPAAETQQLRKQQQEQASTITHEASCNYQSSFRAMTLSQLVRLESDRYHVLRSVSELHNLQPRSFTREAKTLLMCDEKGSDLGQTELTSSPSCWQCILNLL